MTISSQAKVITDFFYGMIPDFEENSGMSLCNICQIVARFIEKQKYLSINTKQILTFRKSSSKINVQQFIYTKVFNGAFDILLNEKEDTLRKENIRNDEYNRATRPSHYYRIWKT